MKFQLKGGQEQKFCLLYKTEQFPFSYQQSPTAFQSILMDAGVEFNLKYLDLPLIASIREQASTQEA